MVKFQNYMKTTGENCKTFLNMHCDVHYNPVKFEIKIQLVYGKTKKINCVMG